MFNKSGSYLLIFFLDHQASDQETNIKNNKQAYSSDKQCGTQQAVYFLPAIEIAMSIVRGLR